MDAANRIFVALDTTSVNDARELADKLGNRVGALKLGMTFFNANGPQGVRQVMSPTAPKPAGGRDARGGPGRDSQRGPHRGPHGGRGPQRGQPARQGPPEQSAAAAPVKRPPLFLDLKFHDIPNTVAGAVRAVLPLDPAYLTLHAGGGAAMIRAAAEAADEATGVRPKLLAVTVLTSLDEKDLEAVGQHGPALEQTVRLARLAQDAGADGVVCSAREVEAVRKACGPDFLLVVPGIRPVLGATGDQKRVSSPAAAIEAGADFLVVGRPITGSPDPTAAMRIMAAQIDGK